MIERLQTQVVSEGAANDVPVKPPEDEGGIVGCLLIETKPIVMGRVVGLLSELDQFSEIYGKGAQSAGASKLI